MNAARFCVTCDTRPATRQHDECRICRRYRTRTGQARPPELEQQYQQRADEARHTTRVLAFPTSRERDYAPSLDECAQRPFVA